MKRMKEMTTEEFAAQVKNLRLAFGLTQKEFADKVGVTFVTMNRWENAHCRPLPLAIRHLEEMRREMAEGRIPKK